MADLDGDNIPDLAVAASSLSVLLGRGDGTFRAHVDHLDTMRNVATGDVNLDGKNDIIESGPFVKVRLGNGDGTFQDAVFSPGPISGGPLAMADFNHDGKPDAVIGFGPFINTAGGTLLMLGNGDGTFQSPISSNIPLFGALSASDFNGDEKDDLLVVTGETANVSSGNGDGTFQSALNSAVGTGPYSVVAADLNQDKAPDIVVTNSADNTVSVLLNTTGADFSISASALNAGNISRGQSSNATVTLNHLNTFDNPVSLTCSVQPAQAAPSCSLNPESITFDATGKAEAVLTVNTAAASSSLLPSSFRHGARALQGLWLPVAGFALMGLGGRSTKRKKLMGVVLGALFLCVLMFQSACGGGQSTPRSQAYTVTINGTSESTQHSATVTLTVQ